MTTGPDNQSSTSADGSGSFAPSPRLVFFGVTGRRDLAQRAAAAAPGVRYAARRQWTEDPGEPHRTLLGGESPVGLWCWKGTAEEFEAQAAAVLLRFVHPLLARELPYCLGFPFGPELLRAAPPRGRRRHGARPRGHRAAARRDAAGRVSARTDVRRPVAAGRLLPASRPGPGLRPGRGAPRRRAARRGAPRAWAGARAGAGRLRQDQDADQPRRRARRPRLRPLRHPHARLQPQGGGAARGAAGGAGYRQHAPPGSTGGRDGRLGQVRPPPAPPGAALRSARTPARRPLRHLQRLRLPLPARGHARAHRARPRRARAP